MPIIPFSLPQKSTKSHSFHTLFTLFFHSLSLNLSVASSNGEAPSCIVYLTIFKPKDPILSVNAVEIPAFSVNHTTASFTFSQYVTVTNPNRAVFASSSSFIFLKKIVSIDLCLPRGMSSERKAVELRRLRFPKATPILTVFQVRLFWKKLILLRRPLPDYLEKTQKDVTANMRGVLIDWLVEVAEEYKLLPDTLYLTVSYIDRFLCSNTLNRQRLQLLGVSSMLAAS